MDQRSASHTNVEVKTMKLCISMTCFNDYFKIRINVFFVVHDTKNYAQTFKEELCHALTVDKPILHLTLSSNLLNSGENFSFQVTEHKITGQILRFHFPQRGWIWQHTLSHITWNTAVL